MRYFLYILKTDTFQEIDWADKKYIEEQLGKKTPFKWQGMSIKPSEVRIYNEKQYRMLKGWNLEDERDLKVVKNAYLQIKKLTREFEGDLSYYGEVLDEEKKIVKNEVLGGEIGLILLAEKLGAIHKRDDDKKQGWFISADENGKTPGWNYFTQLKRAIESYKGNYTYKDEEWEVEMNGAIKRLEEKYKLA